MELVPVYEYIRSWLRGLDFYGLLFSSFTKKERTGRNLSSLQGALEYTLGDISIGWKAALGGGTIQCDCLIKFYLFMSA